MALKPLNNGLQVQTFENLALYGVNANHKYLRTVYPIKKKINCPVSKHSN